MDDWLIIIIIIDLTKRKKFKTMVSTYDLNSEKGNMYVPMFTKN